MDRALSTGRALPRQTSFAVLDSRSELSPVRDPRLVGSPDTRAGGSWLHPADVWVRPANPGRTIRLLGSAAALPGTGICQHGPLVDPGWPLDLLRHPGPVRGV